MSYPFFRLCFSTQTFKLIIGCALYVCISFSPLLINGSQILVIVILVFLTEISDMWTTDVFLFANGFLCLLFWFDSTMVGIIFTHYFFRLQEEIYAVFPSSLFLYFLSKLRIDSQLNRTGIELLPKKNRVWFKRKRYSREKFIKIPKRIFPFLSHKISVWSKIFTDRIKCFSLVFSPQSFIFLCKLNYFYSSILSQTVWHYWLI